MKIIFYNMAYGTGLNGSWRQYLLNIWRFLWLPFKAFKQIAQTLRKEKADVICLAEVDGGSFRNRFRCQAKALSSRLKLPFFKTKTKHHPWSIWRYLLMTHKHHDAILSKKKGKIKYHHLKTGIERLVQEFVIDDVSIFTVHLAVLSKKARRKQMKELAKILKNCPRPKVLCGDFNFHKGIDEVKEFLKETKLKLAHAPKSFPSFKPSRAIDLFLTSSELKIKEAGTINVDHSDHLPVWIKLKKLHG